MQIWALNQWRKYRHSAAQKKGPDTSEPFHASDLAAVRNYFFAAGLAAFVAGVLEAAGAAAAGAAFKAAR